MKDAEKEHKKSSYKEELPPNPFTGRNADEVWKELYAKSKPVSSEKVKQHYQKRKNSQ